MDRRRVVGIGLGALAGAAYGTGPLFFKAWVFPAGVGWIAMLMWRFMFATAVSWAWLAFQPRARAALRDLGRRTVARLLLTGAFFIVNASVYYAAIEKIDISLVALLMSAYPALVAVISLRLGYRFEGRLAWGSLAIVIAGTTLTPDFPTTPGAFDRIAREQNAFVLKLSSDGSGNLALIGVADSAIFPATPGAYRREGSGPETFVVARLLLRDSETQTGKDDQ